MSTNATKDLEARLLRPAGPEGFDVGGLTIPAQGRLGWDGDELFRYRITGLEPSR